MHKTIVVPEKIRVIVDMDDVLTDTLSAIMEQLKLQYNKKVDIEDVTDWNLKKIWGEEVNDILKQPGFFLNLKPKKDAVEAFKRLYRNPYVDAFIGTASADSFFKEKKQYMLNYYSDFPQNRIIQISDKSALWGHFLIDDGIHNTDNYIGIGEPLLYDMPHNREERSYKRIYNFTEAVKIIENSINDLITSKTNIVI